MSLDCRKCGACCVEKWDDGYGVADCTVDDVKRMSRYAKSKLVNRYCGGEDHIATPATFYEDVGKVCDFLRGTPGRRVSCSIYETRPEACRKFTPGSRQCLDARSEMGL